MRGKRAIWVRLLGIFVLVTLGLYQAERGTREVQGAQQGPSELFWVKPAEQGQWSYMFLGHQGMVDVERLLQLFKK